MDSRLLNVFHADDHCINNDYEYWSNDRTSTMEMELTENLNGILPITPIESHFKNVNQNLLIYGDLNHEVSGNIEIVTVDPESEADDFDTNDEENDDNNNRSKIFEQDYFEVQSQSTFRSRTDSSSIGDYESSEYDDDVNDVDDDDNNNDAVNDADVAKTVSDYKQEADNLILSNGDDIDLLVPDEFLFNSVTGGNKTRTLSENTIAFDIDGLVDPNNFDLAEFITKDDITLNENANINNIKPIVISPVKQNILKTDAEDVDSDDSDLFIDVETVDNDTEDLKSLLKDNQSKVDDLTYVDSVDTDPYWNPKKNPKAKKKAAHANAKAQQTIVTHAPLVRNKKLCNFLKGGANGFDVQRNKKSLKNISKTENNMKQQFYTNVGDEVCDGKRGKNLSLIKRFKTTSISEISTEDNVTPKKNEQKQNQINSNKLQQQQQQHSEENIPKQQPNLQSCKRKLNLEEYKMRRADGCTFNSDIKKENNKITQANQEIKIESTNNKNLNTKSPQKHSEVVTNIVKSLKEEQMTKKLSKSDPITEAKLKVLRMQELKKAQQIKIIDSAVSAKVPRVTKVLPLNEIVKDTYNVENDAKNKETKSHKANSDYEEIIIVSVSCNTDISIPPYEKNSETKLVNGNSRSLLKSNLLLNNISNTFRNLQSSNENAKLSSNSLIASIQNVVVNKTFQPFKIRKLHANDKSIENEDNCKEQHGEDKIIMHLRKDRIRARTVCAEIQTDLQPEFPLLPIKNKKSSIARKIKNRNYRKKEKKESSSSEKYSDSTESDASVSVSNSNASSRKRQHTHYRPSGEHNRQYDVGYGGYSSRSSRRHRSSVSSSYSESERRSRKKKRRQATSYTRQHRRHDSNSSMTSSSMSDYTDRSRSHGREREGDRTPDRKQYRSSRSRSNRRHSSNNSSRSHKRRHSKSRSRSCSNRRHNITDHSSRSRSRSSSTRNSRSHSRSCSSRSRSRSPYYRRSYTPTRDTSRRRVYNNYSDNNGASRAVEERRIVYVGRIEDETTKEILRRRFIVYGTIKRITVHTKETGMKYGFVTFERAEDAFTVIDTYQKDPRINKYDISFGGRRAFCRASYADLDNAVINNYQTYNLPHPATPLKEDDSFEALLLKVKQKINANKSTKNGHKM